MTEATITRQEPASTRREPALDGLRGLAVLLVYVYHYGGGLKSSHTTVRAFGHVTQVCWIGVTIFFALSGFLITGSLWDSRGESRWLRNFYVRRALRIFPLYYIVLALSVLITFFTGTAARNLWPYVIHAFFLQDMPVLSVIAGNVPGPVKMYHFWTLAIEEHFYLLWPAALLFARTQRRVLQLCAATFILSAIFRVEFFSTNTFSRLFEEFPLTHVGTLALGAALALLLRSDVWPAIQRWTLPTLALSLAAFVLTCYVTGTGVANSPLQLTIGLLFASLFAAATIPLALRSNLFRNLLSITPLRFLGVISYGFYIFHILLEPAFDLLAAHLTHATQGQQYQFSRFILAFPLTLVISWLSYRFLELPFLRLKHRFPTEPSLPA